MRVLVTGHRGYIGVEMVPALKAAGHEVVGLDTGLFDECDFAAPPDDVPSLQVDLRDVEPRHIAGFDAVIHLAALSNDPLGDLNPGITYDINLHASMRLAKAAKAAGVRRFLFSSSCSLYGAGGEGYLDESAAFYPVTAYGESKVRVEQELAGLADSTFSPVVPAERDRIRRLAPPPRRHRGEQPGGRGADDGQGPDAERRDALAPARAHPRHQQRVPRVPHGADRRSSTTRPSTSGARPRTSRSARSRTSWPRSSRTARSRSPRAPPRTRATTGSTSARSRRSCPATSRAGRCATASRSSTRAYTEARMTKDVFHGPRYYRLRTVKGLCERGLLDQDLRRKRS